MSDFIIYDTITADQDITTGDLVMVENDYIEVTNSYSESDSVVIKGYSHISGDDVFYIVPADSEVSLWLAS